MTRWQSRTLFQQQQQHGGGGSKHGVGASGKPFKAFNQRVSNCAMLLSTDAVLGLALPFRVHLCLKAWFWGLRS